MVDNPDDLGHKINNLLLPDTDYVFKIRAIYPDGPGVFSEPCIMKTLPDGMFCLSGITSSGFQEMLLTSKCLRETTVSRARATLNSCRDQRLPSPAMPPVFPSLKSNGSEPESTRSTRRL